jgi:hypothetical protein
MRENPMLQILSKINLQRTVFVEIIWHMLSPYEVVSESSWTVTVLTASMKEDGRGGQGHTSARLLHQSAM